MMARFTVPLSDILGSAYYRYELTSSDYNPTIDSTITITCTCKNVLGNPIANKTLELLENGVSQGTSTTNANGIATWSITLSAWGNKHFHIGNATLDLTVTGWRIVADNQYEKVQYNEDTAQVIIHTDGLSFGASWAVQSANILGSAKSIIKPKMPVVSLNYSNSLTALSIRDNGELWKKSYTGSSVTSGAYCLLEWHY